MTESGLAQQRLVEEAKQLGEKLRSVFPNWFNQSVYSVKITP